MRRIAALFPGQGSQKVGMGRELAASVPAAAEVFERAREVLDTDLSRIAWEGTDEELTRTENAQPAILTHSLAVWAAVGKQLEGRVEFAAGHSLGEFSAYAAAGALDFEDALRVVRRRGELMAASRHGTMSAVIGLDSEQVEEICREVSEAGKIVVAANHNSPGQVVISGEPDAVETAGARASEAGARMVKPLPVSGAFHSPLMKEAEDGLRAALSRVEFRDPEFPVVSNVTAEPVTNGEEARELLIRQLTSPVRWSASVAGLIERGIDLMVELGPGNVLTGLLKRIDRSVAGLAVGESADLEELRKALT